MATRKPIVRIGGRNQQLPAADSLDVPGARFHEGPTEPTVKSYGDRWLQDTTGIEYTWVAPGVWVDLNEATAADVAASIHAATSKTTPIDTDELGITDSAASYALKHLTWANLKATLLAYFRGEFRERLTAVRTYYVRTDGSDSNTGLSNSSGGAFLTIQKAIDVASVLDNGGFDITITVGSGTFTGQILAKSFVGSGKIIVIGAGSASTTVDSASIGDPGIFYANGVVGVYQVQDLKLQYTGAGTITALLLASGGSKIYFGGIAFGAGSSWHVAAQSLSYIECIGNYSITGAANTHVATFTGGFISIISTTITITGTPAFATAFARSEFMATQYLYTNTFSGSATGKRYQAATCGGIRVAGAGATYLPGNVSGTATSPGWYE